MINAAGEYLNAGLYQLLRQLFRRSGGNESYFSTSSSDFDAGLVSAAMKLSSMQYLRALDDCAARDSTFPVFDSEALGVDDPALNQSAAQVFHNVDERCRKLGEDF